MLWIKRIFGVFVLFVVAVFSVVFVLENQSLVRLQFAQWQSPEWPIASYLAVAFFSGAVLGLLGGQTLRWRLYWRATRMAAQQQRAKEGL